MKITDFVKNQLRVWPFQIIGAGLLLPAFVLAVVAARRENMNIAYAAWAVLTVIGVLDLYIIRDARKKNIQVFTITQWVRESLPKRVDYVVMFGFIALVWWLAGPLYALFYMHGFLNDHFNENR